MKGSELKRLLEKINAPLQIIEAITTNGTVRKLKCIFSYRVMIRRKLIQEHSKAF